MRKNNRKYTIALFGDKKIKDANLIRREVSRCILDLTWNKKKVEILIGNESEFDIQAAIVIRKLIDVLELNNCKLILLLSGLQPELTDTDAQGCYDEIDFSGAAVDLPQEQAVSVRNREMIDRADFVVCWVEEESGEEWNLIQYALQRGKLIENLCLYL